MGRMLRLFNLNINSHQGKMWVCLRVAESKVRCNLLQTALHSTRTLSVHHIKHHGPSNTCLHLPRVPSNNSLHVQCRSAQHLPHIFTLSLGGLQVRCMTSSSGLQVRCMTSSAAHKPNKEQLQAAQQYMHQYKKGRRTIR